MSSSKAGASAVYPLSVLKHMLSPSQRGFVHDGSTFNLYLCHLLSTWNARSYEFGSVLFTAAAFPEGLSAASWIGISTSLALILFASSLGCWVDHAPSRLQTLLTTITINRTVVILACSCWAAIIVAADNHQGVRTSSDPNASDNSALLSGVDGYKQAIFLIILFLGIIERLSRLANLISIERDWVPTLAIASDAGKWSTRYELTQLNATMSRIDLVCKLGAPIVVSMFMSATKFNWLGPVGMIAFNFLTWPLEYWTAQTVWKGNFQLQATRAQPSITYTESDCATSESKSGCLTSFDIYIWRSTVQIAKNVLSWTHNYKSSLISYFATEVWMPSLAITGLHFSVLVFSGSLTVFLINSGFSLQIITWAEIFSAFFELSSTYTFPFAVRYFARQRKIYQPLPPSSMNSPPVSPLRLTCEVPDGNQLADGPSSQEDQRRGVSRLGIWALALTLICLIPTVPAIWQVSMTWVRTDEGSETMMNTTSAWEAHRIVVIFIILFVSISRLGRWTSSLCGQQLAQSCVLPCERSMFAGTEASLASTFGLGHWVATVIWSKHEDFRWIALSSLLITVCSTTLYAFWLLGRGRRYLS